MTISQPKSTNSYFIRILFILFIIILVTLFLTRIQFVSNDVIFYISTNQSLVIHRSEQKIRCIVYVQERQGRLGNRMFIVANAYGLARLHSCHLYVSTEILQELKQIFVLNFSSLLISSSLLNLTVEKRFTTINRVNRTAGCEYLIELTRPNAIPSGTIFELTGYWQSYLHFAKYGDELREYLFAPVQSILMNVSKLFVDIYEAKLDIIPPFSSDNRQLLKKQLTRSNSISWIGMHIRRTDFVGLNFSSSDDYFFSAMNYFTSLYPNAHFLVATDDKPYCKNLFRNHSNVYFTPNSFSPGDDLIALSVCHHSIVTGGTFSWWTGYLTNGLVVHDKVYPTGCERREHYYPPWYMIDGKVRAYKNSDYVLR